jgi:hypothetical protein
VRSTGRRWLPWAALAVGLVAVALVLGPGGGAGEPYDPRSPERSGAKGVVDTLRQLGVPVRLVNGAPAPDDTAALVLVDQMDDATHEAVSRWVERGGTLVVADPRSPLTKPLRIAGDIGLLGGITPLLHRNCDLPALRDVGTLKPAGGVVFRKSGPGVGCFTAGNDPFLVAVDHGRGTVVALGGASPFLNALLGQADNAAVAVDLLAPTAASRVAVLLPPRAGGGRKSLVDLIPRRVKLALWQLVIAFLVVVAWRARRLGRPVPESQLVAIPGSELVGAVGQLMQRARGRAQAAGLLRDDVRRQLAERLGLPPTAPPETLAGAVAGRARRPADDVVALLTGPAPVDEAALVELARSLESLRTEVTSAP